MTKYIIKGKEIEGVNIENGRHTPEVINELLAILDETPKPWSVEDLKEDDKYWYIDTYGDVNVSIYEHDLDESEIWRKATGNMFPTEEAAKAYKNKLLGK